MALGNAVDEPNQGTLIAARHLVQTAREALGRGEKETASALMEEVDRLLELAWGPEPHWPMRKPY